MSQTIEQSDEDKVAVDARKKILRKKLKKHEVQYHVLSKKKDDNKT